MAPRGTHLYQHVYQLPHRPAANNSAVTLEPCTASGARLSASSTPSRTASPTPSPSPPTDVASHATPSSPSGTKRRRPGDLTTSSSPSPTSTTRNTARPRHRCKPACTARQSRSSSVSSTSSTSSFSSLGGSDDSDSDSGSSTAGSEDGFVLPSGHDFHAARPGLLAFTHPYARKWKLGAVYRAPPEDRLPPRKRARTSGSRSLRSSISSSSIKQETDASDPQLVVVSHADCFFHLACPYWVRNNSKYRRCLLDHDLQSVEALVDHLCNDHMEPPCCAICYRVFDRARDRDDHMSRRACALRDDPGDDEIDGLDLRKRRKITSGDSVYHGERRRWFRIWKTLFPRAALPRTPYLDRGVGLDVSAARDYWLDNGRARVSQYLSQQGLLRHHRDDEERALAALSKLALQDLLARLLSEHDA